MTLQATTESTNTYDQEQWQQGYTSQTKEYDYWIDEIEGEIPAQLEGTLFRNGPGLLDINGTEIRHPFDGDGMICAVTFTGGRAHFRNRFVRTEGFVREQEEGKILYRGVFGTQKPGNWLQNAFDFQLKNIANTNVIYWGGKLLALWEAAEPHRLNPHNLETIGLDYLDGILQPGDAFAAHPWVDPHCEFDGGEPCLVNFSVQTGISSKITIFEFSPTGKLLRKQERNVPGFAFMHDFAITPNYCIFFQNSVSFNPIPYALGLRGAGECVKFQPHKPTKIILIPRQPQSGKDIQILEIQAGFVFHHGNAFEQGEEIVLDSICYEFLPELDENTSYKDIDFSSLAPSQLWRFNLDLASKKVTKKLVNSRCCEFPTLNPNQVGHSYRYLFMGAASQKTGSAPLQGIQKLDWDTGETQLWDAAPTGYVSEPIFVPKPQAQEEDEGWLLTLVYDGENHRSDVVILDASNLHQQPIAKLHLKNHIPYGLHGSWTSQCFL